MCSEVSIFIVTCLLALYVKYLLELSCKAKDAQVAISLLTTCNNLLRQSRYQDPFAWLATACWRQACCKLSTDLLQVAWKYQNLLSTGLLKVISTSCNKSTKWKAAKSLKNWQRANKFTAFWLCMLIFYSWDTIQNYYNWLGRYFWRNNHGGVMVKG